MLFRPWTVGLFMILGLGFLAALLFMIGDRQKAFSHHVVLQTEFSNVSGLMDGAKVRVSGIDAGKIEKIDVPKSASEKFRLHLQVEQKFLGMVHKDSVASIETEGVVGDKLILIKRGTSQSPPAQSGDILPSKEPFELSVILDRANGLLDDVHGTITEVRGKVTGTLDTITATVNHADNLITDLRPNLNKISRDASHIAGNLDVLSADIMAGKGPAGLLLRDEETRQQLQATIANVKDTSRSAQDAATHADQIITDFQSRQLIEKAQVTLQNVQALTDQLNTTVKDALAEDSMGENGAANLRQTLSNINRSTANLAEDTEALKHNFFFRGFFKKRGFYSLDQISPDEYVKALERHKNFGKRLWLQASPLFANDADGQETLTADGRRQIDDAVTSELKSLAGHLIIVEGYAVNGSPSQQVTAGRRRADLVRRYLETHYHLRHSDMGIVALGTTTPPGGRAGWDGAAIMLLEAKH